MRHLYITARGRLRVERARKVEVEAHVIVGVEEHNDSQEAAQLVHSQLDQPASGVRRGALLMLGNIARAGRIACGQDSSGQYVRQGKRVRRRLCSRQLFPQSRTRVIDT